MEQGPWMRVCLAGLPGSAWTRDSPPCRPASVHSWSQHPFPVPVCLHDHFSSLALGAVISFLGPHLPIGTVNSPCTPWRSIFAEGFANLQGEADRKCGQPFPSTGNLPDPEIKPMSPALQPDSLPNEPQGKPKIQPIPKQSTHIPILCLILCCMTNAHEPRWHWWNYS